MKNEIWPQSKMTSWPQWPQKRLVEFFQKLHLSNQCIKLEKMSYVSTLPSFFFRITNFLPWSSKATIKWLKSCIFKGQTTKLRHSSSSSAWCTDLKNVIFERIHSAPSRVIEVIFEVAEAKFCFSSRSYEYLYFTWLGMWLMKSSKNVWKYESWFS